MCTGCSGVVRCVARSLPVALMLLIGATARAETYFVRAGGDDRADGASAKTAFRTVTRAAQSLMHGDRIVIGPGVYKEAALISERFGTPAALLAIAGDESGRLTGDAAGAVAIEPAIFGEPALFIHRSQHVRISGLTFRGQGLGLRVEKTRGVSVERCTFDGLSKGAEAALCEDLRLESCVFLRCVTGAQVKQTTRSRLAHLTVASCSMAGLMISGSSQGEIRNSIFAGNNTAMVVDPASGPSWSSDHNAIAGTVGTWGLGYQCRIIHEWFAASGQERHSTYALPAFADPAKNDLHIAAQVTWGGGIPGMNTGILLDPKVETDREGQPFTVRGGRVSVGAYNYPEPQPAADWKKLAVTPPAGVRMSAGVTKPGGTLVRMLLADEAAVSELWWDGRDDAGAAAAAGQYEVRAVAHDIRFLDDGNIADNGSPLGTYNCDNAERVVVFADGSFVVSTFYDEAGIPLRYHTRTGVSICGSALAESDVWAIADAGNPVKRTLIAGVGRQLQTIVFPGERAAMADGARFYTVLADGEKLLAADGKTELRPTGLAVAGGKAYVALPSLNVIRVIDLANGAKVADWAVGAAVGDAEAAPDGAIWALAGTEVVVFRADGKIARRHATGLATPRYMAIGAGSVMVSDPGAAKIAVLKLVDGSAQIYGKDRPLNTWMSVSGDLFGLLRDLAIREDGTWVVCEAGRVRCIDPATKQEQFAAASTFMDVGVAHPLDPTYVYVYGAAIHRVDPDTGAWRLAREMPRLSEGRSMSQSSSATLLRGKPYVLVTGSRLAPNGAKDANGNPVRQSVFFLLDVTTPLEPRIAGVVPFVGIYNDARVAGNGDIVIAAGDQKEFKFNVYPFKGFDAQGNPNCDFSKPEVRDCGTDTSGMGS